MHFVPLIVCVYVYLIQRGEGEIQHIAEFGNLFHDYCSHNPPKALFFYKLPPHNSFVTGASPLITPVHVQDVIPVFFWS